MHTLVDGHRNSIRGYIHARGQYQAGLDLIHCTHLKKETSSD
jgi:hypothetical protein